MNGFQRRIACTGLVCAVVVWNEPQVVAQSTAARSMASTATASTSTASTSGLAIMPVPIPLFMPSMSNGSGDPITPSGGVTPPANIFANPYGAALMYSSMLPPSPVQAQNGSSTTTGTVPATSMGLSPAQMGLLMMAAQQPLGIGSGRLSGVRPGSGGPSRPSRRPATAQPASRGPRTAPPPGGLAAPYFNRTGPRSPYPQSYYNRQNRYFP